MWLFIFLPFVLCFHINIATNEQINVFGKQLQICSLSPATGYYRSGLCEWNGSNDYGVHTVCAQMTREFLEFTRSRGNDLSTPRKSSQFPGLHDGDRWCLCAARWKEALRANVAPPVILRSTHTITLQYIQLGELRKHVIETDSSHLEM